MLRAIIILAVSFALLVVTVLNQDMRAIMALVGIAATCMGLDWLTKPHKN